MSKSPQDVLSQIKDEGIELIDLKFTDIHGKWQHLTLTSDMIEEDSFTEGLAFDGSSTVSYTHLTLPTNREV